MNIFKIFEKFKIAVKSITICAFCIFFLISGFPQGLILNMIEESNIIDGLYLSSKDSNIIDNRVGELTSIKKVKAADFSMQTGYYIGNGGELTVSGLGFQPDFLIIKSNTASIPAVFKTAAMSSNISAYFSATADNEASQIILNSDGFTVGAKDRLKLEDGGFSVTQSMDLTLPNIRYTYTAFTGSDCSATGNFCVGSYVGNGTNPRNITVGFQPDFVMVKRNTAVGAHFKITSNPANESLYLSATVRDTSGNFIRSFAANSFQVGSSNNTANGLYYYVAFKNTPGKMTQGSYVANNIDNRNITGLGFKPDFVLVKNATNTTAGNTSPVFNIPENYGDNAGYFAATANTTNTIQELQSDGFQVGNSILVNGTGTNTMYYVAFAGSAPPVASGGNFLMETGSYTGNGGNQNIGGIKFKPDLIIIKANTTQQPVFRTQLMAGDVSYILGIGTPRANAIMNINNDGFSVGNDSTVNTNAVVYQWQAFGNAFNPHSNSGSSSFAIGSYIGTQVDNRNITRLPFQPDFILTKTDQNYNAAIRTSSMVGDLSGFLTATAESADVIQSITTDGFQLGTSATLRSSNYAGYTYHWFAFKDSSYFKVGNYTGDGLDNRNINTFAIDPNLVWIKQTTAVAGIYKASSLAGDSSQYFSNTANASNRIQSFITGGIQIGNGAEVNTSAGIYRYIAWAKPPDPTGIPGVPGAPTFSNIQSGKITINWSSASGATSYRLERAIELEGVIKHYKEVANTTSTSYLDNSGIGGNLKYWYRVVAYNSNGHGGFSTVASVTTPAQTLKMQTGYYIGNQGQLSISGLGFTPEFLIIKSDSNTTGAIFETSLSASFVNADIHSFGAASDNSSVAINLVNARYIYIAYSGQDCTATGSMCIGAYNGTGTAPRTITLGFQPNFVMVKNNGATGANFKTASNPVNETLYFAATVRDTTGNFMRSFTSNSFLVGATNNLASNIYYYVAFKTTANFMIEGTYTADGLDNRNITGLGFQPEFVFVKNATNTTAANVNPMFNTEDSYGDASSYFSLTINEVNSIQALIADGFQVGNNIKTNGTTDTMYYVAFNGNTTNTNSGTFKMQVGSYVGNGTTQNITGLGFKPDLIMIKDSSTNQSVFRTSLMASDSTGFLSSATANSEGGITRINADGFTIGTHPSVNNNTNTYYWQAFGNAYNPHTNSGASDFAIGAYTGNAIDNRSITRIPYSVDMVTIKSITNAGTGFWRTSNHSGDLTSAFSNLAETSNTIQALNSTGFEIGSATTINTTAVVHFWFAFKNGANFNVGGYTGNGTTQNITSLGFQPDLVWAKSATTVNGVFKPSNLAGNNSQSFAAVANATTQITAMLSNGFSVGAGTGANQSTITFRYASWRIPPTSGTIFVEIVDAGGNPVGSPSIAFNTIDTTFACQTTNATFGVANQKIRVTNQSANPAWSLSIGATSGVTSLWNSGANNYDYNDNGGSPNGCNDSADPDTRPGQLSFDFSSAVITPQVGCSNTGISLGSNASFLQGVTDSIVLLQASGSADTNCYWDITGVSLTQKIPQDQNSGNYNIDMSLSVISN